MKILIVYLLANLVMYLVVSVVEVLVAARKIAEFSRKKVLESGETGNEDRKLFVAFFRFFYPSGPVRILRLIFFAPVLHYNIYTGALGYRDELLLNRVNLSDPIEVYRWVCLGKYLASKEVPVTFVNEDAYVIGRWMNCKLNILGLLLPYRIPSIIGYKEFAKALVGDRELIESITAKMEQAMKQSSRQVSQSEQS